MLSVYIVDDEKLIRDGLRNLLDWEELGFSVEGDTGSADRALRYIADRRPDVVIVDIKMPRMSGIELIQRLRAERYDGAFIIISGYSEFEYAQSAIKYGVNSYLLKPIDERELAGALYTLRRQLKGRAGNGARAALDERLTAEKQWERYLCGYHGPDGPAPPALPAGLPRGREGAEARIVIVRPAGRPNRAGPGELLDVLGPRLRDRFGTAGNGRKGCGVERLYSTSQEIVLLSMEDCNGTALLFQRILKELGADGDASVLASIGGAARGVEDLPLSYRYACDLLEKRFLYGYKGVIAHELPELPAQGPAMSADELCDALLKAIQCGAETAIHDLLERWKNGFIQSASDEIVIKMAYTGLYTQLVAKLAQLYREITPERFDRQRMIEEAYLADNIISLGSVFKKYVFDIFSTLSEIIPDTAMNKAIAYLKANYRSKISIEDTASLLHYNRSYFGRKFKSYTGESFSTYLDKLRIEKAKELIGEGYKIYKVAEMVGYSNVDYFNHKFRRYVGMSPTELRRMTRLSDS